MDVNPGTVLPGQGKQKDNAGCEDWRMLVLRSFTASNSSRSDLELIGDNGGDAGAGASASSSSSSPHSSSLRGVMLFPNHTEWIDTCRVYIVNNMQI